MLSCLCFIIFLEGPLLVDIGRVTDSHAQFRPIFAHFQTFSRDRMQQLMNFMIITPFLISFLKFK